MTLRPAIRYLQYLLGLAVWRTHRWKWIHSTTPRYWGTHLWRDIWGAINMAADRSVMRWVHRDDFRLNPQSPIPTPGAKRPLPLPSTPSGRTLTPEPQETQP
jgi:hypothetical protein